MKRIESVWVGKDAPLLDEMLDFYSPDAGRVVDVSCNNRRICGSKIRRGQMDERDVHRHLGEAWEAFLRLPRQHPDEIDEFRHGIHLLQGLMAMRVARKHEPEDWPIYEE